MKLGLCIPSNNDVSQILSDGIEIRAPFFSGLAKKSVSTFHQSVNATMLAVSYISDANLRLDVLLPEKSSTDTDRRPSFSFDIEPTVRYVCSIHYLVTCRHSNVKCMATKPDG